MSQADCITTPLYTREEQGVGPLFPSYYLAPISYYARLVHEPFVSINLNEPYRKQTLRNRCWIASPNGPLALTIPVVKFVPYRTPMRDIRISDHGNWRHLHWNALQSSYGRTPFFEFYADDFAPFYEKKWDFLADYNQALQELVLRELSVECGGERNEDKNGNDGGEWRVESGERNVFDLQHNSQEEKLSSLHYPLSTLHQKGLSTLHQKGLSTLHQENPSLPPYYQLFSDRHGFMSDLSIVDLLFNMGPESILYLLKL